jgi:hypothetical protein
MNKLPRKLKKKLKGAIIVYDLASAPKNWSVEKLLGIHVNTGVLAWDSRHGGQEPKILRKTKGIKIKDLNIGE